MHIATTTTSQQATLPPLSPKMNALLNPMVHLAVAALAVMLLGGFATAQGFDFGKVTAAVCEVVQKLTGAELLGAAGFAVLVIFGWNKLIGDSSAFQGVKNALIGAVIILGAGTFATAIFGGSC